MQVLIQSISPSIQQHPSLSKRHMCERGKKGDI
jgi:hypothetical protein